MKICHNIYLAFLILFFSIIVFGFSLFQYGLAGTSSDSYLKEITIEPGSIQSIATTLYKNNLIRSKLAFNIYTRLTGKTNLKAATYSLSENMGTKKIVDILLDGKGQNLEQISITFQEGLNMKKLAKTIAKYTDNTEENVYETLEDTEYLKTLINKYWFLEESILNSNIYYSLEGYLYPNTYYFSSTRVGVEEIIEKMLEETQKQLEVYRAEIENSSKTVHQIITLASIVELEGTTLEDRKNIVSVFNNRLSIGMNLGSDVTTYYGARVEMGERDLYTKEVQECNHYNTRCSTFLSLPVSPICNPSIDSIIAVLQPIPNSYYYFVADKNKKVYFSETIAKHNETIAKLKKNGKWYEY